MVESIHGDTVAGFNRGFRVSHYSRQRRERSIDAPNYRQVRVMLAHDSEQKFQGMLLTLYTPVSSVARHCISYTNSYYIVCRARLNIILRSFYSNLKCLNLIFFSFKYFVSMYT